MVPRKLVFVTTALGTGGAEMMLYKLLRHLRRTCFDPIVISLMDKGTVGPLIEGLGVPVYAIGMRASLPSPASIWRFQKLVQRLHPDLIQGWMYHGNIAALYVHL